MTTSRGFLNCRKQVSTTDSNKRLKNSLSGDGVYRVFSSRRVVRSNQTTTTRSRPLAGLLLQKGKFSF